MHKYKVDKIEFLTPTVLQLSLKARSNSITEFMPGQYCTISFRRFGRPTPVRCFSISSSPIDQDILQFGIRVKGDFTNAIKTLKPGSTVKVGGPFGEFVIDEDIDKRVLFLAGGIGITPFMSMIRYASQTKMKIPITLLYSCQTQDDVPFYNELIELEKKTPYFNVGFFITTGSTDKLAKGKVFKGRINEDTLDQVTAKNYDSFTHFICGPNNFMKALQGILIQNGVSPQHLITEVFGQGVVTEKSHKKKSSETKLVYAFTGVLLVLGTVFITGVDLVRAVPKISRIENVSSNSNSNTQTKSGSSTTGSSTSGSSTSGSSTSSSSSSNNSVTQTQTTQSNPVTSVS